MSCNKTILNISVCVCQRDFPVGDHVTLSNYHKSRCVDDLCNTEGNNAPTAVQPQPSQPDIVVPPVVVVEEPEVVEEVIDETPEEETPDFLPGRNAGNDCNTKKSVTWKIFFFSINDLV